jgi:hypothetical protein
MSNRRKRQHRRRILTAGERYLADRYPPHRNLSSSDVRRILIEDGTKRQPTPLAWFLTGIEYISVKDKVDADTVFIQINDEVTAATGLPLPTSGLR